MSVRFALAPIAALTLTGPAARAPDLAAAMRYVFPAVPGAGPAAAGGAATITGDAANALAREALRWARRDRAGALELISSMLEVLPNNAALRHAQGVALLRTGAYDDAAASLARAVELDPRDAAARVSLARALLLLRRTDAAAGQLERALELDPRDRWANAVLAGLALTRGELLVGRAAGSRAIARAFSNEQLAELVAWWEELADARVLDASLAATERRRLRAEHDEHRRLWLARTAVADRYDAQAAAAFAAGRFAAAREGWTSSLDARPDVAARYFRLAAARRALGDPTGAVAAALAGLDVDPDAGGGLHALAGLYFNQRDYDAALVYAHLAMAQEPEDAGPWLLAGRIYQGRRAFERAITLYRTMLGQRIHVRLRDVRGAPRALSASAAWYSAPPENARIYLELGDCYFGLDDYAQAADVYLQGLELDPENGELAYRIGFALSNAGDLDGATVWAQRSARLGHTRAQDLCRRSNLPW